MTSLVTWSHVWTDMYLNFPTEWNKPSSWGGQEVPIHTQEALENYLIHGYAPGGFLTSVLSNDLYGSVVRADHINKQNLIAITDWIINHAPSSAWGSPNIVKLWLDDADSRRTAYAESIMKAYTWKTLQGEQ